MSGLRVLFTRERRHSGERRIKGWSRRKKRALIDGDWLRLKRAAKKDFKRKV